MQIKDISIAIIKRAELFLAHGRSQGWEGATAPLTPPEISHTYYR